MSLRLFLFIIFTLSGFSGLIYESVWTHYLKLFLGHAAWAQTIVLAIFMGGMALGAWLCSRYSHRWQRLLRAYAMAEAAIGLMALAFHYVFSGFTALSYDSIIPMLGGGMSSDLFKWLSSALIILPQSVLLGMTFPLMSGGLIRRWPDTPGNTLAMLYFTNSIGAAVGILAAGFLFIDWFGLPGTMQTAGIINLVLALAVWYRAGVEADGESRGTDDNSGDDRWVRILLAAALLTGMASFIYEIAWIRMLSLVLSSSTHSFELMLSAFILGLALGGLWIRNRIDRIADGLVFLARVQIFMGLLAFATLLLYGQSFAVMEWLMQSLPRSDGGYTLFNLASSAIAMLIMVPVTFCAGMTLPLITLILYRRGQGERAIGRVYGANTLGAIIGVMLAVHVGLPLLGLKGLLASGAILDIVLGLSIWWLRQRHLQAPFPATATAVTIVVSLTLFVVTDMDRYAMASGVYRGGKLLDPDQFEILLHRDGKAASVSLTRGPDNVTGIRTNGKVDASIYHGPLDIHTSDEATMILAAALPLLYKPDSVRAANIGMGSGLTTHALMYSEQLDEVDTIEIEAFMVEAARAFGPRVQRAWSDPRSNIFIDDAKTFFASHGQSYDFIISEPSNPWVSGTASLFTEEFYHHVSRYLHEDGILVQWLQLYEIDLSLVASVIKALSTRFPHYTIYTPNDTDILILATRSHALDMPAQLEQLPPGLQEPLASISISSLQDLQSRYLGNRRSLHPLFMQFDVPANSDYYPYLDLNAARSRFLGHHAKDLIRLGQQAMPLLAILEQRPALQRGMNGIAVPYLRHSKQYVRARETGQLLTGSDKGNVGLPPTLQDYIRSARPLLEECITPPRFSSWLDLLFNTLSVSVLPYYQPRELQQMLHHAWKSPCAAHTTLHKHWLGLWYALASRDNGLIARQTQAILADAETESAYRPYLMMITISASLSVDDHEQAQNTWEEFREAGYFRDSQPLNLDLLRAHLQKNSQ